MNGTHEIPLDSPICPTRDTRMGRTQGFKHDWYTVDSPMCTKDFVGKLGHECKLLPFLTELHEPAQPHLAASNQCKNADVTAEAVLLG